MIGALLALVSCRQAPEKIANITNVADYQRTLIGQHIGSTKEE
jgi:hypothetical protein